ncbi:MAG: DUF2244 domain-containing protein [Betaproteobacteria bacterium]|nr:DUF2244 domain-containing protein [Betaproteobacteria bacterium]MDE2270278.1 DUF2244 domain-containing protein [Betaproteobacteria bacterium]
MDEALCKQHELDEQFPSSLMMRPALEAGAWIWRFRRNCSISPSQLFGFFVSFALLLALLSLFCWGEGARMVTPFAGLEVVAVGVALIVYARHAADFERISVSAEAVVIEWSHGGREQRVEFHPRRARILAHGSGLVHVSDRGRQVHIGRFLRPDRRQSLARDLRRAILLT